MTFAFGGRFVPVSVALVMIPGAIASRVVAAVSVTVGALYVYGGAATTQPAAFGLPNSTDRFAPIVAQVVATGQWISGILDRKAHSRAGNAVFAKQAA